MGTWGQTPAGLDIEAYAGLTITGTVGTVYSIECVTNLAQTNNPNAWQCLEFLQLPVSPHLWMDKSAPITAKRFYRTQVFPPPTNMVFIPPGTFMMGSPTNDVDRSGHEVPQVAVTITKGFFMGKYEVTIGEYLAVMGYNPSYISGVKWAVDQVTWYEATNYCATVTRQEHAAGRLLTNCVYRLPTEAEWEYACRARTSTRFSYGDDPGYTNLANYAYFRDNSGYSTQRVGRKLPNPWNLYDMHGNVSEWCQDQYRGIDTWYTYRYPAGIAVDPETTFQPGPSQFCYHVARGGSCGSLASCSRSASRTPYDQNGGAVGFRVVLVSGKLLVATESHMN